MLNFGSAPRAATQHLSQSGLWRDDPPRPGCFLYDSTTTQFVATLTRFDKFSELDTCVAT